MASDTEPVTMAEGVEGTWHYHLRRPNATRALCGAMVFGTAVPLSAWGYVGHLRERYCSHCEPHLPREVSRGK